MIVDRGLGDELDALQLAQLLHGASAQRNLEAYFILITPALKEQVKERYQR